MPTATRTSAQRTSTTVNGRIRIVGAGIRAPYDRSGVRTRLPGGMVLPFLPEAPRKVAQAVRAAVEASDAKPVRASAAGLVLGRPRCPRSLPCAPIEHDDAV